VGLYPADVNAENSPPMKALLAIATLLATSAAAPLPPDLRATGFGELRAEEFAPQYPLWSDGQAKRRWLHIPDGAAIDESNPDRWEFPAGTRAWKEFSRDGRKVETRFIERRADGSWRYATYLWNEDGTHATLAPADGVPDRGIPSRADCVACHEGAPAPILGYSAVQLRTKLEPAIGYLHGNCGHCHNNEALPALDMVLAQRASDPAASTQETLGALLGRYGRFRHDQPRESVLLARMRSTDPLTRMPPIGVSIPDSQAIAALETWLTEAQPRKDRSQ
jgi:hypothetical protein